MSSPVCRCLAVGVNKQHPVSDYHNKRRVKHKLEPRSMDSQTTAFYFLEAQCAPEPPRELVKNEVVPRRCAVGLDSFLHVSFGENAAWPAELWELDATEQPRTTRPQCLPRSGHSVNDSAVGKKPVLKAASRPVWWPCCLQNSASGFPFSPQGPDAVSSPRTVVEPVGRVVAVVPQASCLPPGLVGQPVFSCGVLFPWTMAALP